MRTASYYIQKSKERQEAIRLERQEAAEQQLAHLEPGIETAVDRGEVNLTHNERLSPEAIRMLQELGYSVESKSSDDDFIGFVISWESASAG